MSIIRTSLSALFLGLILAGCQTTKKTTDPSRWEPKQAPPRAPAADGSDYIWTPDHMQIGVRWQPFGRPGNDAYEGTRPVIAKDSSYAQFWVSWRAAEPTEANTDYRTKQSGHLKSIEAAVDVCAANGVKVEFVFWHCPAWASVSGEAGGWKPKEDHYQAFVTRIAKHFKGRVHAYQLAHEANLAGFMQDGDIDYLMSEVFVKGGRAIRAVYDEAPTKPVIVSTTGCSPCEACGVLPGLKGKGGVAVNDFYNRLIANDALMEQVDALNFNVTDHFDGYGNMDGHYIPTTWGNYDLIRSKLDASPYPGKKIMAAESWIVWDDARNAVDVNGDGEKNEIDAYEKAVTIMGQCLQRGLNTMNLPWSDNSSGWAMGLTKRRDYNGRIKELNPEIVVPADDGGPDVVTTKLALRGNDTNFTLHDGAGSIFTVDDYAVPSDPNHLHYYVWKWYAQLAGGSDEVIRHAMADEPGNDISVTGPGFAGSERYRASSYNRSNNRFTVLLYADAAKGKKDAWTTVSIPATIQKGRYYNNNFSTFNFREEGFADGDVYHAHIVTKDLSKSDGSDVDLVETRSAATVVTDGILTVRIPAMNTFTTIEFIKGK